MAGRNKRRKPLGVKRRNPAGSLPAPFPTASLGGMDLVRKVSLYRHGEAAPTPTLDEVAVEEPMELRLDGHPVSVLMRTPGHDEELAAGFLVTEGLIHEPRQLRK